MVTGTFYTCALSFYYLLRIRFQWTSQRLLLIQKELFCIPIVVGLALATAGIPHYQGGLHVVEESNNNNNNNIGNTNSTVLSPVSGTFWVCYIPSSSSSSSQNQEDDLSSFFRYALIFTVVPIGLSLFLALLNACWLLWFVQPWKLRPEEINAEQLMGSPLSVVVATSQDVVAAGYGTSTCRNDKSSSSSRDLMVSYPQQMIYTEDDPNNETQQHQQYNNIHNTPGVTSGATNTTNARAFRRGSSVAVSAPTWGLNPQESITDGTGATPQQRPELERQGSWLSQTTAFVATRPPRREPSVAAQGEVVPGASMTSFVAMRAPRRDSSVAARGSFVPQALMTSFVPMRAPRRGSSVAARGSFHPPPRHTVAGVDVINSTPAIPVEENPEMTIVMTRTDTTGTAPNTTPIGDDIGEQQPETMVAAAMQQRPEQPGPQEDGSAPEHRNQKEGLREELQQRLVVLKQNRAMTMQCVYYVAALLFSWTFVGLAQILARHAVADYSDDEDELYPFWILVAWFGPLQGLLNALAYWYSATRDSSISSSSSTTTLPPPNHWKKNTTRGQQQPEHAPSHHPLNAPLDIVATTTLTSMARDEHHHDYNAQYHHQEQFEHYDENPNIKQTAPGVFQVRAELEGRSIVGVTNEQDLVDISSFTESHAADWDNVFGSTPGFNVDDGHELSKDTASSHKVKAKRRSSLPYSFMARVHNGSAGRRHSHTGKQPLCHTTTDNNYNASTDSSFHQESLSGPASQVFLYHPKQLDEAFPNNIYRK